MAGIARIVDGAEAAKLRQVVEDPDRTTRRSAMPWLEPSA
jgi:hypothetical protein